MSPLFEPPLGVLTLAALAGTAAFVLTRRFGRAAGHLVWLAVLGLAFMWLRDWYPAASHCDGPPTVYVPFIGAFTAASGAWRGITMSRDAAPSWYVVGVPVMSAATALIPGFLFLLSLWPCR